MMAQAGAVRARAHVVKPQSRLMQDDCGSDQGKGALVAEAGKPRGRRQQSAAVNWDSGRASLEAQGTAGRGRM